MKWAYLKPGTELYRPTIQLEPGDIFLTRNAGDNEEEDNATPGYWNHAAMYVGNDYVVEAQAEPDAVIYADLDEFWTRYPLIKVLRYPAPRETRVNMARHAIALIGVSYAKLASIFFKKRKFRTRRGENCVSTVRKAVMMATGRDPRWHTPDGIAEDKSLTEIVERNELVTDKANIMIHRE